MIIVKVTLLLLLVFSLSGLLRGHSAALRHLIWTLGLAGSVGLLLATPLMPSLSLRVPAAWLPAPRVLPPGDDPAQSDLPAAPALPERSNLMEHGRVISWSATETRRDFDPVNWLPLVYAAGILTVLAWYTAGRVALWRMSRQGREVTAPEWLGLLEQVKEHSGVSTTVRLIQSGLVGSPITWGLRRPVIVLPPDANQWDVERRRVVLAHELAHAARGDHVARLIGVIACAVYWFHPMVWAAFRRQRVESERAADDHVLMRGIRGTDYASHLLEIARHSRGLRQAGMVAIGMARPSELEGRLIAVLDEQRERRSPPRRVTLLAWIGLALVTLPAAAASPDLERYSPRILESLARSEAIEAVLRSNPADSLVERTIDTQSGETLYLDLDTGGDVTIEGWDRAQVRVRARLAGTNWRDTRLEIDRSGDGVRVLTEMTGSRGNFSTSHEFDIMVPLRYNVRLESSGGGISITQVEGQFRGSTGGGDMQFERTRGEARLKTGGGDIDVSDSDLEGYVRTGGGRVLFSGVKGGIRGSSGSGPVMYSESGPDGKGDLSKTRISGERITVAEGSTGVLHISKAGGDIILDGAPDGLDARTGGGTVRIGSSRGMVKVSTGGGDITIGPVAGSVRAGTGAGDVRITIAEASGQNQSVEVTAGVGNVVIDWPAGVAARFDLETAYTRNFGRRTRINTELKLEQEETERWDDSQGTPRRYVRSQGQVGQGGGVVSVRTVNGDITIRTR